MDIIEIKWDLLLQNNVLFHNPLYSECYVYNHDVINIHATCIIIIKHELKYYFAVNR